MTERELFISSGDFDQDLVVTAKPDDRIIVDAPPGTGKTAVACSRVAFLIDSEDCEPSGIWLISFTRTAVAELRHRISCHMVDPDDVHSVRIATLDSHAWSLHSGFNSEARLDGGYDANIESFLKLLQEDPEVQEYIGSNVQHLIIDEAQDIVGLRADLLEEFLKHLNEDCGVTIFSDAAQSIYGFTTDSSTAPGNGYSANEGLISRLKKTESYQFFEHLSLNRIFRTDSKSLLHIFTSVRNQVMEESSDIKGKLHSVIESIRKNADGEPVEELSSDLKDRDDVLILYRSRGEALFASSWLRQYGVSHRLRMSGLPVCIHPWVAKCLAEHVEPTLSRQRFSELWNSMPRDCGDKESAWQALVRTGGRTENLVDMSRLTSILGRMRPPAEFCMPDLGNHGPIVGTIHASKGRESPSVHLMLPRYNSYSENSVLDEETRVVFVGATRAKKELLACTRDVPYFYKKLESSGRVFRKLKPKWSWPRAMVQIGLDGDVGASGVAGRTLFTDRKAVQNAQERLGRLECPLSSRAVSQREKNFAYALITESGDLSPLTYLSSQVNSDLFEIGKRIQEKTSFRKTRPPEQIHHLSIAGVRSLVLSPESPERELLHYPWSASGIVLAPIVLGFPTLSFPYQKKF